MPFSNPNVEEIPEVAREHTILSMLGVTSHTPRTHELLSAHNMVSAWNGLTTKVQVGEWRKVKFIGCGCSQGPKDYFNTVAKMSTFDRAYENATILIFHRLQTAHNSDDSNVTINTPSTTTPRKPHPRAAKVVTPFPDTARATTPARITKQDIYKTIDFLPTFAEAQSRRSVKRHAETALNLVGKLSKTVEGQNVILAAATATLGPAPPTPPPPRTAGGSCFRSKN